MKKEYAGEIVFGVIVILLILYMIFTWKNLTPETEGSSTEIESAEDSLEGVDL